MAKLNPANLHLRLPIKDLEDLRRIAAKQRPPVEAAELLRRAAVAIIDCDKLHGTVPAEMVIRGKGTLYEPFGYNIAAGSMLNEDPAAIGPMGYTLGSLPKKGDGQALPKPRS